MASSVKPPLRAELNFSRALRQVRSVPRSASAVAAIASIAAFAPTAFAQVGGTTAQDAGAGAGTRALQLQGQGQGETANSVELNLGLMHSDNIRRMADNDKASDTVATVGFTADTVRDGSRVDYRLLADMAWAEYLENSYKSQPFGALDGNLQLAIVPSRFFWDFRDSYSQVTLDPLTAATPDNIESFNYLTTGPRAEFAFGSSMLLSVYGTYSDVHYMARNANTADSDSNRYTGGLTLRHLVSEGTSTYLALTSQKVEFDDVTIVGDYKREEAYVGYHLEGSRTFADLSVGANRLDRTGGTSQSGFLGRMELARKVSPSSTVSFQATQQIADSVDMFRSGFDRPNGLAGLQEYATNDPFRERLFGVSWNYQRPRTSFTLSGTVTQDRYENQKELDRSSRGLGASITRRLNPLFDLGVSLLYQRDDFDNIAVENKQFDSTAALAWHAGRQLDVSFQYTHAKRDSTGQGVEYTENRIGATFAYSLTQR
jgi:hypothetical protein